MLKQTDSCILKNKKKPILQKNKNKGKQYGKYSQNNKKLNLLNKIGKVSRCLICDSKMHWVDQCRHKNDSAAALASENETKSDQENCEEVNIVLMIKDYADIAKSKVFVAEASKSGDSHSMHQNSSWSSLF